MNILVWPVHVGHVGNVWDENVWDENDVMISPSNFHIANVVWFKG